MPCLRYWKADLLRKTRIAMHLRSCLTSAGSPPLYLEPLLEGASNCFAAPPTRLRVHVQGPFLYLLRRAVIMTIRASQRPYWLCLPTSARFPQRRPLTPLPWKNCHCARQYRPTRAYLSALSGQRKFVSTPVWHAGKSSRLEGDRPK